MTHHVATDKPTLPEKKYLLPLLNSMRCTAHTLHIDRLYKINYSTIRMMLSFTHLNPPHLIYCTQYRRGSKECILWGFGRSHFFRYVRSLVFRLMLLACMWRHTHAVFFPFHFTLTQKKNPDWREHSYFCYYSVRHVALARSYAYENVWQYLYFSLVIDTCSRKNGISWLNYVNNRTWTVLRYACYRYLPVSYKICCFDFLRKIAHAKYIAIPAQHRTTDTKNGFFFTWKKTCSV